MKLALLFSVLLCCQKLANGYWYSQFKCATKSDGPIERIECNSEELQSCQDRCRYGEMDYVGCYAVAGGFPNQDQCTCACSGCNHDQMRACKYECQERYPSVPWPMHNAQTKCDSLDNSWHPSNRFCTCVTQAPASSP